jgi:hypothetical protein
LFCGIRGFSGRWESVRLEGKKQTVKQLQKPLVLLVWNVVVLWGVEKLCGYQWLLSVLLGVLSLTVFALWMFLNIVLYEAIAGICRARYGRRSMTLRIRGEEPDDETVDRGEMRVSTDLRQDRKG